MQTSEKKNRNNVLKIISPPFICIVQTTYKPYKLINAELVALGSRKLQKQRVGLALRSVGKVPQQKQRI